MLEWGMAAMLLAAFYTDIRYCKIPNWLCAAGILAGGSFQAVFGGVQGTLQAAAGMAAGLAVMLLLYLPGAIGAGDVKLFAALGAFSGPAFVMQCAVYSILYAGVIGVGILLRRKLVKEKVWLAYSGLLSLRMGGEEHRFYPESRQEMIRFPFMYAVVPAVLTICLEKLV
ncbi:A24 family peptidase [Paenibacillus aurantius]|uniref:A24 family peptidase n=1 Tax=Paenibacillus aurantius TaxID=2918900 RepID=A0AA96L9Q1_9BACL|nr:A24 family peptidase [Paenibacillus aurantius]WNQ09128.1 A24 family peptidase [Paenibacillus aurantius]